MKTILLPASVTLMLGGVVACTESGDLVTDGGLGLADANGAGPSDADGAGQSDANIDGGTTVGDAAATTWGCANSTYKYCCEPTQGCGFPTWAGASSCASTSPGSQVYFFDTPCDGFLARSAGAEGLSIFDADSGVYVADFTFFNGTTCAIGPPSGVAVAGACFNLWLSGAAGGGTQQCQDAGAFPADFCAYLFPDGGGGP